MTRLVLRTSALIDCAAGIVLALTTWDRLFETFGVSAPDQAVFAQAGAPFVVAIGYVLWIAPRHDALTQAAAAGSALAHGLVAALCVTWLLVDGPDLPARQLVALSAVCAASAAIAALSLAIARRNVAMLLPPD